MSAKPEQAVNVFREGSNCSQAVISVYAEDFGLSRENALKISRVSKLEGAATAKENGLFATVCPKLVGDATEILEEMMIE